MIESKNDASRNLEKALQALKHAGTLPYSDRWAGD